MLPSPCQNLFLNKFNLLALWFTPCFSLFHAHENHAAAVAAEESFCWHQHPLLFQYHGFGVSREILIYYFEQTFWICWRLNASLHCLYFEDQWHMFCSLSCKAVQLLNNSWHGIGSRTISVTAKEFWNRWITWQVLSAMYMLQNLWRQACLFVPAPP